MYAEGNKAYREMYGIILNHRFPALEIELVEDGTELARRLSNGGVANLQGVIANADLPGISGEEVVKKYRGRQALENVPFILYSPHDDGTLAQRASEIGADAFVSRDKLIESFRLMAAAGVK